MKKAFVYDAFVRVFHIILAVGFITAFSIGKFADDESALYPVHMMIGMTLSFSVFLRILWGFFGTKYARFSSFNLEPSELIKYFKNLISSKTELYVGHNPASSWTAIIMMILVFALGATGFQMVSGGNKELFEEIHEIIAHVFLLTVIGHIAGIIIHTIRHKDPIGLSMITGTKHINENQNVESITVAGTPAIVLIALVVSFAIQLSANYDKTTGKLNMFGQTLQLGEVEDGEHEATDELNEEKESTESKDH